MKMVVAWIHEGVEHWYPGYAIASWKPLWRKIGLIPLFAVVFSIVLGFYACESTLFAQWDAYFVDATLLWTGKTKLLFLFVYAIRLGFYLDVFMLCWCLLVCVILEPGSVHFFHRRSSRLNSPVDPEADASRYQGGQELFFMTEEGVVAGRKCHVCKSIKPARGHHCSMCQKCVMRMDHHCLLITNCVGLYNHKFFLLFLSYAWIAVFFVATFAAKPLYTELRSSGKLKSLGIPKHGAQNYHRHEFVVNFQPNNQTHHDQDRNQDQKVETFASQSRSNLLQTPGPSHRELPSTLPASLIGSITQNNTNESVPWPSRPLLSSTRMRMPRSASQASKSAALHDILRLFALVFGYFACVAYVISLGILNGVSWKNALTNVTTIETFDDDWRIRYSDNDMGWRNNLKLLFGPDHRYWLLPVKRGTDLYHPLV